MQGYYETNNIKDPLTNPERFRPDSNKSVGWDNPQLKAVTRLRLVSDRGFPFWDVSYCWGILENGEKVYVDLPFSQLPKRGMLRAVVAAAKEDNIYAKGLGLLDPVVISLFQ